MGFYQKQLRIALRNCGFIDPENIDEYIARDGYAALGKVLTEMDPKTAVEIMKKSGLRGRGGGKKQIIKGVEEALLMMHPGEKATLIVPWYLASVS